MNDCLNKCTSDSIKVVIVIILYSGLVRLFVGNKHDDPLIKLRAPYCGNFLNGWTGAHFLFFSYLGYKYPTCFSEAMLLGVLWEIFEYSIGEILPTVAPSIAMQIDPFWTSWYYGCYEDIVANALGFQFGILLKNKLIRKKEKKGEKESN